MYFCTHCHKTSSDKSGWYFDGIGGSYCQNCIFLAIELLDQDPPNAKEPAVTETAVTQNRCAFCHKFLRLDEQWQFVDEGMFAHKNCFAPPPVEVGHGETPPEGYDEPQPHRYNIGDHVTLHRGTQGVIVNQWHMDSGTPGYGLRLKNGYAIGIAESHIYSRMDGANG